MKSLIKTLIISITFIYSINISAQNVYIPDPIFKAHLVSLPVINTNGDSEIQVSEANTYTGPIGCGSQGISDLTGIEHFTNLTTLFCDYNQITYLDLSQNTALTTLFCFYNQLTTLDLSNNSALVDLQCYNNPLECLNIKNGNNSNFNSFIAANNANLTCIEVDDAVWSTSEWTFAGFNIDSGTSFSTNCACSAGLDELSTSQKELVKIIDLMGRETEFKSNKSMIYLYSDGTTKRVYKFE